MRFTNKVFKYTGRAYASRIGLLLIDTLFAVLSLFLAAWLRQNFVLPGALNLFYDLILLVLPIRILSFRLFRTYAVILDSSGLFNIVQVVNTVLAGSLLNFVGVLVLRYVGITLSLSVVVIDFFILIILMAGYRMVLPFILRRNQKDERAPILIIGAGKLGLLTKQLIDHDQHALYRSVAFIDENPDLINKYLDGIPVISMAQIGVYPGTKAIFAIRNIGTTKRNELIDACLAHGIQVLKVPPISDWLSEEFDLQQIREIQIEDLLGRPAIRNLDLNTGPFYEGKTILITGAAGSIGSEIVRQLIPFRPGKLVLVDQAESALVAIELECREKWRYAQVRAYLGTVTDVQRMERVFREERPQMVFHAAAYKHVPIIEDYPEEGVRVNVLGTKTIADLAHKYRVNKMVLVSTDKAVNPTNIMGASKRVAERYIQTLNRQSPTEYIITRFGNVLGSVGSVVPRFQQQIEAGGPITVTHPDINRYFMTIPEASLLVVEAAVIGQGGEVVLFDMGEPVKIVDLAKKMIQLSGKKIDLIYTGLRKGEKLYEELLIREEETIDTPHPKLKIAKNGKSEEIPQEWLDELIHANGEWDITLLSRLVPEYTLTSHT